MRRTSGRAPSGGHAGAFEASVNGHSPRWVAYRTLASLRRTRHLVWGVAASVAVLTASGAVVPLALGRPAGDVPAAAALGALGGLVASLVAYGMLPVLDAALSRPGDVRLLELASPGHPLLKRLMLDAPGTYTHSVMTGHLAEQAAEAIGADPLLARVGAYYHDIGKLHRPDHFCENLDGAGNPHDDTAPLDSARIITAHVRDGVALAHAYGLPEPVCAIINEHHGTSLLGHFYDKAVSAGARVAEDDFRYGGHMPSSREAALVMLADAAEAAVRCVRTPTTANVEAVVRRVIDQRAGDRQLDEAGLSVADLERVTRVYARMLVGLSHPRVAYPEPAPRTAPPAVRL